MDQKKREKYQEIRLDTAANHRKEQENGVFYYLADKQL